MKTTLVIAAMVLLTSAMFAQKYSANVEKSEVKWLAKKVGGQHDGTIAIKSGGFEINDGKPVSGLFVIDMKSIKVLDIPAGDVNAKLVGHLNSADFFDVEKFAEAKIELTEASPIVLGSTNVKANLTIKGITNSVQFVATQKDNLFSAKIIVDRSLYNVRYGSGKFFENLGDKTIYDDFEINVTVIGVKK